MQMHETVTDGNANIKRTQDGYVVATPRCARSGIQLYSGQEVGRPDLKGMVKVFRPETEVFSQDTIRSFAHRPVTVGHPPEMVDASNWKKYSVGNTTDPIIRDGEFVRCPVLLMDKAAIAAFESGQKELSMGYDCDLLWEPGTTDSGEEYQAVQRNIRVNHCALVQSARGGDKLRLGDEPKAVTETIVQRHYEKPVTIPITESRGDSNLQPETVLDAKEDAYQAWKDSLNTAWQTGKSRETIAAYQPFSDAESERARYIADMESAWKQKPRASDPRGSLRPAMPQPVSDQPTTDASEAAYRAMCADLENAWRKQA